MHRSGKVTRVCLLTPLSPPSHTRRRATAGGEDEIGRCASAAAAAAAGASATTHHSSGCAFRSTADALNSLRPAVQKSSSTLAITGTAVEDPFKAGMAVMKEAAAADAAVKKGDDSMKPEAARLYGERGGLLQQAIDLIGWERLVKMDEEAVGGRAGTGARCTALRRSNAPPKRWSIAGACWVPKGRPGANRGGARGGRGKEGGLHLAEGECGVNLAKAAKAAERKNRRLLHRRFFSAAGPSSATH